MKALVMLSLVWWWLSACAVPPAPHDSSTRMLNEMKVGSQTPEAVLPSPASNDRISLLERRIRELEDVEARNRELEALLAAERASATSVVTAAPAVAVVIKTYEDVARRLQPEIDKNNIHVVRQGNRLTITLADRLLFDSGSDQLRTGGLHVLEVVGHILGAASELRVQVNGHTDNVPIGDKLLARFPTNLALSQARASHVADVLRSAGVAPMNLEAVGYGEQRPIGNNMLEEGRRKNRRVELVVLPRQN